MIRSVLILSLWCSVAEAVPRRVLRDKGRDPSDSERTMATELKRGRQLASKGQHAEAVHAFDAALRSVPDEPRVLNELGWELRLTGDLTRAEEVCRKAAKKGEPPMRAPALYNLGRVLEQRGDKPAAILAYRESLDLRENKSVRERLLDLDPSASKDAFGPHPLDGPVASIAAWCAANKDESCHLTDGAVHFSLPKPQGQWLAVEVFTVGESPEDCAVGVRTKRGWFVGRLMSCKESEFRHGVEISVTLIDRVPSAVGPELEIEAKGTDSMKDYDEEAGHSVCCLDADFKSFVVCGIGASGTPHCTPDIDLYPSLDAPKNASDTKLAATWANDELVLIRDDGKPIDDKKPRLAPSLKATAGRHRLVFP